MLTVFIIFFGIFGADLYSFDASWNPQFPVGSNMLSGVSINYMQKCETCPLETLVYVTQRGNTSISPVVILNAKDGSLVSQWGDDYVGIDPTTKTWGSHGIAIERCETKCVKKSSSGVYPARVYIEDFTNHTVTAFDGDGKELFQMGTNGIAGNGTNPIQFGNVADGCILPAKENSESATVYLSDGDGGYANRVVRLSIPNGNNPTIVTDWATKAIFHDPHSIAYHRSGVLVIADRGHLHLHLINAENGEDLGFLDCGLDFGAEGTPFGVRIESDLLFIASMDNPQDGKHQRISIVDISSISEKKCSLMQTLKIDPAEYSGPHLLGIDPKSMDLYAALVSASPLSTVLRFKRVKN